MITYTETLHSVCLWLNEHFSHRQVLWTFLYHLLLSNNTYLALNWRYSEILTLKIVISCEYLSCFQIVRTPSIFKLDWVTVLFLTQNHLNVANRFCRLLLKCPICTLHIFCRCLAKTTSMWILEWELLHLIPSTLKTHLLSSAYFSDIMVMMECEAAKMEKDFTL
jgi:hypothetical protein